MSKRYGRNKRRADRAKIAALESKCALQKNIMEHNHELLISARHICNIAAKVNPYSALLPPLDVGYDSGMHECHELTRGEHPNIDIRRVNMYELELRLEKMRDAVHYACLIFTPESGVRAGYKTSMTGLELGNEEYIARTLVRNLKHDLGMKR